MIRQHHDTALVEVLKGDLLEILFTTTPYNYTWGSQSIPEFLGSEVKVILDSGHRSELTRQMVCTSPQDDPLSIDEVGQTDSKVHQIAV